MKLSEKILRVNETAAPFQHRVKSDKVSPNYIRGGAQLMKRTALHAEPVNPVAVTRPGPYRTGDGDIVQAMRPGADDHLKYKSLTSVGQVVYPRGHK